MYIYLSCEIGPGQFSGEVAVLSSDANGNEFSLFVPEELVDFEGELTDSRFTKGWLRVDVLDKDGTRALVRLPGQAFENGTTVTVSLQSLQERLPRETA